jgi:LysM repeat protein
VSADSAAAPDIAHMPLLSASQALFGIGGGESPIDDGALVADLGPSGSLLDIYDVPSSDLISTYIVKPGDSIGSVAAMFDVTVNTIRWANNMNAKDGVTPGQELLILPVTGVKHTVKSGDTLASLAKKYDADQGEIAQYNGLGISDGLSAGSVVIIPNGEVAIPTASVKKPAVTSKGGTLPGAPKSSSVATGGYFIKPTAGIRTQGFHGPYNALDIGAPVGTQIVAAASGKVIVARSSGYNGGYGKMVIIQHGNGTQTLYGHMSAVSVTSGQTVTQGQRIGAVGNTGRSTGPHLHWEVRGGKTPDLYGKR